MEYCIVDILKEVINLNRVYLDNAATTKPSALALDAYMKATNELIVILVKRILDAYKIDKNLDEEIH